MLAKSHKLRVKWHYKDRKDKHIMYTLDTLESTGYIQINQFIKNKKKAYVDK